MLAAPAFYINNFFPPDSIPLAHDKLDVLQSGEVIAIAVLQLDSPEAPLPYPFASIAVHLFSDITNWQCPAADMH